MKHCAYDTNCDRIPRPFMAMCDSHTDLVMSSAFGPVSWTDRAALGVLPTSIVGGSPAGAGPHAVPLNTVARSDVRRGAVAPRAAA